MSDLKVIETYKGCLQNYSLEQLRYKTTENVWSIGQMYDHLIVVAHEYLDNVEACAASEADQKLGKSEFGEKLFKLKDFPPIKIKLPNELNSPPNNSDSKEKLMHRLEILIQRLIQLENKFDALNPNSKVNHKGFGWLNAREWYDLVGMHFRHHLRQKRELDQNLSL
ncbi:DinB family protein [Heyndrickxia sporothermodurans]